jgi:hypothetical protein
MRHDALPIKFHLPRLSDDDLQMAVDAMLAHHDHGPAFCGWLCDALQAEQLRRLSQRSGEPKEAEYLLWPAHELTNSELTQSLAVITAWSYKVPLTKCLGELVDKLVRAVVVAVGARLKLLEEVCDDCFAQN